MSKIRMAVVGAGEFGRNHIRVIAENPRAELTAIMDTDAGRASELAKQFHCTGTSELAEIAGLADAVVVAVPTTAHSETGVRLMEMGLHVLVEKPIADDLAGARELVRASERTGRILQVGHLERFNPAVTALTEAVTVPLFFEVHRMSVFTPRSLDIDVVLDLMIHDLDIVLSLVGEMPEEIRAAGLSILSGKVDIANVRLAFPGGCVANLTASRVSTERVRKLRLFQPNQYISIDYTRQEAVAFSVSKDRQISFNKLPVTAGEPLQFEIESFLESIQKGVRPRVSGEEALRALEVAVAILDKIEEHSKAVAKALAH
ncbi:MAG TPA: Gfo/Idh/MocA family oxidoreductase [Bryobacteraceae bacterium]|nr:Gfo/Idh/MocA family oxidoreductase [Bryobacteraceae bacterium]